MPPPVRLSWRVTSQVVDQTTIDAAGNVIVGSYIYYTTGEGNKGVVFVPNNKRTAKSVQAAIHADAMLLDEIGQLFEGTP